MVSFSEKERKYISSYYYEINYILALPHDDAEEYLQFREGISMSAFVDDMKHVNKEYLNGLNT